MKGGVASRWLRPRTKGERRNKTSWRRIDGPSSHTENLRVKAGKGVASLGIGRGDGGAIRGGPTPPSGRKD